MPLDLSPARALVFRIVHIANLARLLTEGLHSRGNKFDPEFVLIGNPDLIEKRAGRRVPVPPGGTLADYVPFYFTPKSPMLLNIKTGYHGIVRRADEDIAILVSSCQSMADAGVSMLFTDRHAYAATAKWSSDRSDLSHLIDWDILERHDFARDEDDPDKMERYQAEALAHRHVPPQAIMGIGCVSDTAALKVRELARAAGSSAKVVVRPQWYFR